MTAPHAVMEKFPPPGKPKSPGLAAGALERRGHRVDLTGVQS
jgi:hypothetical protein